MTIRIRDKLDWKLLWNHSLKLEFECDIIKVLASTTCWPSKVALAFKPAAYQNMSFCHDNNCVTNSSAIFTILNLRIYEFVTIYFSIVKLRQKACFGPIRNLFYFSTVQSEKKLWKELVNQIGESIWWIR